MDVITWISIVSGIVGILGFIYAVVVQSRANNEIRRATAAVEMINDIAEDAIRESRVLPEQDDAIRLIQLEKLVGFVFSMWRISRVHLKPDSRVSDVETPTELDPLVRSGIVIEWRELNRLETSRDVKEVWLATYDLEPDESDAFTGRIVKRNIEAGKRYAYFYPAELKGVDQKLRKLQRNIGADDPKLGRNVQYFAVRRSGAEPQVFSLGGNAIIFFKDDPSYGSDLVFREIVLTKLPKRGVIWQECSREQAVALIDTLREEMAPGSTD